MEEYTVASNLAVLGATVRVVSDFAASEAAQLHVPPASDTHIFFIAIRAFVEKRVHRVGADSFHEVEAVCSHTVISSARRDLLTNFNEYERDTEGQERNQTAAHGGRRDSYN